MDDAVLGRIDELVAEEQRLHELSSHGDSLTPEDRARLTEVELGLDQCWDLLRQRRARRDAGLDPDAAPVRPTDVVEGYQQ